MNPPRADRAAKRFSFGRLTDIIRPAPPLVKTAAVADAGTGGRICLYTACRLAVPSRLGTGAPDSRGDHRGETDDGAVLRASARRDESLKGRIMSHPAVASVE